VVEFISIITLTFALTLIALGLITSWLEEGRRRLQGIALTVIGLLVGVGYAFLASRFSIAAFGQLIVRVDLPRLMATAFVYTAGVVLGAGIAVGLFLWATDRFRHQIQPVVIVFVAAGLFIVVSMILLAALFGA